MVKRLDTFISWMDSIAVSAIAIATYTIRSTIQETIVNPTITMLLLIAIVVLLSRITEFLIKELVSKSRWLRRIVLGTQFIEGRWIDKVVTDGNVESIALLTITYSNNQFEVNGESLDLMGDKLGAFHTYISVFDNWELKYAYHGVNIRKGDIRIDGYGEYNFVRHEKFPLSFLGFLHDSRHMKQVHVQAEKVYHPTLVAAAQTRDGKRFIIDLFLSSGLLQWQFENNKSSKPRPEADTKKPGCVTK
jgi:hypothetical protein